MKHHVGMLQFLKNGQYFKYNKVIFAVFKSFKILMEHHVHLYIFLKHENIFKAHSIRLFLQFSDHLKFQ
jgi:hypothetical protein